VDKVAVDQIRFCAFCPNVCRSHYPTSGIPQREYMAPSALSYLVYAVMNDLIKYDEDIANVLTKLEACDACKAGCPYHYDIPTHLRALAAELKNSAPS
jgi:Fe-S oxidoreductase